MKNYISDPTSNRALGTFDRELRQMHRDADRLLSLRRSGQLTPAEEQRVIRRYGGNLRRMLLERLEGEG